MSLYYRVGLALLGFFIEDIKDPFYETLMTFGGGFENRFGLP